MNAENQTSENAATSNPEDSDVEDFDSVSDAASHVLSVLRDVRNSRCLSASPRSLELSNRFSGVAGRRRARRSDPVQRRGRGRRASFWRTHIVCLSQRNTTKAVTRSELELLTRAGLGMAILVVLHATV